MEGVRAVRDLAFADPQHGWLLQSDWNQRTQILSAVDGGRTWQMQYPTAALAPSLAVSFVTTDLGFGLGMVGDDGKVLQTTDGGVTWQNIGELPHEQPRLFPDFPRLMLSFVDADHGWAVTPGGRVMQTMDAGHTWTPAGRQGRVPKESAFWTGTWGASR